MRVPFLSRGDTERRSAIAFAGTTASLLNDTGQVPVGRVDMGNLRRLHPLSEEWGSDRGEPIDRTFIARFLAKRAMDIHGRCLEAADRRYTEQFGGDRVLSCEVLHRDQGNPGATLVGDLARPEEFPKERFDCIVLTQVLQYVFDLAAAVETLHRMLEPGGILLATLPAISPIDQNEWDGPWLWTFTELSAKRLFGARFGLENISVESYGNVLAAEAFLQGMAAEELAQHELEHVDSRFPMVVGVRAQKARSA